MKAKELMIGDWAMNPNDGKRYKVHTITACEQTRLSNPYDLTDLEYGLGEPIPLTAEILEKNGFRKFGKKYEWKDHIWIQRWTSSSAVGFTILDVSGYGFEWEGNSIRNVHLLQHALRLCGLDDLADNFKI